MRVKVCVPLLLMAFFVNLVSTTSVTYDEYFKSIGKTLAANATADNKTQTANIIKTRDNCDAGQVSVGKGICRDKYP